MTTVRIPANNLLPETEYAVRVRAKNASEVSEWSARKTFTTIADSVLPITPMNVSWVAMDKHFKGEWDKVNEQVDGDFAKVIRYDVELEKPDGTLREVIGHPATDEPRQKFKLGEQKMQAIFGQILTSVKFRVRAVTQNENKSEWSDPITAGIGAPDPPTNLTITPGPLTLKLEWTPPVDTTNLDGYRVYYGSTAGFTPVRPAYQGAATTYTFNATSFDIHYFKVCSYSRHGLQSSYVSISGTPGSLIDSEPPDEPGGITGTITNAPDNKTATAEVNWTLATVPADLGGFNIRFRKVGQPYWDMVSTDAAARTVSFEVTPFVDYEVSLQSLDENANGSAWTTPLLVAGVVNTPPPTVTGLTSVPSRESIKYSWNASTEGDVANQAGHYELQVSTVNTFAVGSTATFITGYPTYDALGLVPNTTHYARVRAVDSGGMTSVAWSTVDTETTLSFPSTPLSDGNPPTTSPAATVVGGIGYLHVSWPTITNADPVTYEVHLSTTAGFTPTLGATATKVGELNGTAMVVERTAAGAALDYGTTYYVRIIAKDVDTTAGNAPAPGTVGSAAPVKVVGTDVTLSSGDISGSASTTYVDNAVSTSANGKNKIVRSTSAASGTTGYVAGDVWYQYSGTNVIGFWIYSGTVWESRTLDNAVLASLDAGKINTGYLDADRINASTIGVEKLIVADLNNYVEDTKLGIPDAWTGSSTGFVFNTGVSWDGNTATRVSLAGAGVAKYLTQASKIAVKQGDVLYAEAYVMQTGEVSSTGNLALQVRTLTDAGVVGGVTFTGAIKDIATMTSGTWYKISGYYTVGANIVFIQPRWMVPATATDGTYFLTNFEVRRVNSGQLIIDGSLTANKITAGTYTGGEFIIGAGGILKTVNSEVTLTSSGITVTGANSSIVADAISGGDITAGKTLNVKGTMNVAVGGWIQSEDFASSGGASGYRLTNSSLTIKTGSISAGTLTTGSIAGGAAITITGSSYIDVASGFIRGGGYTGTTHSSNPSGVGWFIGSGGINIPGGSILIPAGNIQTGSISSATIQITGTGSIYGTGWSLGSGGLQVTSATGSTSIVGEAIKTGAIKSSNYQPGVDGAGWSINTSGSVEFNTGTFRGTIYASGGTFAGTVDIGPSGDRIQIRNSGTTGIIDFWDGGGVSGSLYGWSSGIYVTGTLQGPMFSPNNITLQSGGTVRTNYLASTTSLLVIQDQVQMNAKLVMNSAVIEGVSNLIAGGAQFSGAIHLNNNNVNSVAQITASTIAGDPVFNWITGTDGSRYVYVGNSGKLSRGAASSDERLKTNLRSMDSIAEKVLAVEPFKFDWKDTGATSAGFMANRIGDLGEEFNQLIARDEDGRGIGVDYPMWVVAQQSVLRLHQREIAELKARLAELESR